MGAQQHLLALLLVVLLASDALAALSFSVHGDWGIPIDWANTLANRSEKHRSQFTLGLGDNFYGRWTHGYNGVKSTTDTKWKTIFEDVYTHRFFNKPWYMVAGNHDHEGSVRAQINYSTVDPKKRWKFPRRYHIVHKKVGTVKVDLFMIDTTPLSGNDATLMHDFNLHFDKKQVTWLSKQLKLSKAKWKIVVGHHPIFSAQQHGNYQLQKHIQPLLERHKVAAYINGHAHSMQHVQSPKLHYITIGNGAIQSAVDDLQRSKNLKIRFIFPTEKQFDTICSGGRCRGFGVVTIANAKTMSVFYYAATGKLIKKIDVANPNR